MTPNDKEQIRAEYRIEQTNARRAVNVIMLAKRYGVSQQTIREIAKGQK